MSSWLLQATFVRNVLAPFFIVLVNLWRVTDFKCTLAKPPRESFAERCLQTKGRRSHWLFAESASTTLVLAIAIPAQVFYILELFRPHLQTSLAKGRGGAVIAQKTLCTVLRCVPCSCRISSGPRISSSPDRKRLGEAAPREA